ncbi:hypothetical protein [Bacillus solimangrovi]|nr:hypothetical protein [Bacillus solimangrovi]
MDDVQYRKLKKDFFIMLNISIVIMLGLFCVAFLIEMPVRIA